MNEAAGLPGETLSRLFVLVKGGGVFLGQGFLKLVNQSLSLLLHLLALGVVQEAFELMLSAREKSCSENDRKSNGC